MRRRSLLLVVLAALALAGPAGEAAGAGKGDRASPARLKAFSSCATLTRYARRNGVRLVREQTAQRVPSMPVGGPGPTPPPAGGDGGGTGEERAGAPAPVPLSAPGSGGDQNSQTNVQEAGVDEPDIVKLRGGTLLALVEDRLHAVDATASPPRLLGTLSVRGFAGELVVHGDRALVLSQGGGIVSGPPGAPVAIDGGSAASVPPREWTSRSVLTEVDISDPSAMRVVRTLDVEGTYVSARVTGATARIVVASAPRALEVPAMSGPAEGGELRRRWTGSVRRAGSARWRPSSILRTRRTGGKVQRPLMPCRRVRRARYFSGLEMITVLTVDMERGLPAVDTDTVMSDGQTVYASPRGLYVATERWLGVDPTLAEVEELSYTAVHKFDASERGQTAYAASGEVPGFLLNQWSLSEHEGVLRVATTSRPSWLSQTGMRPSRSAVRTYAVRDGRLVELGRVGGLGEGEQIFAVRFMGDVGFVVTFRQTDPLYALDLSKPAEPKLVGELKVPGYSAYLHPIGDDLLLGVGQDATEQGALRGVQLSLFDVADLRRPVRLDQVTVGGRYSETEVERDHHAFVWWQPTKLAVIPVTEYGGPFSDGAPTFGAHGFRVDRAGKIQPVGSLTHPGEPLWPGIRRAVVVGDRLVTVSAAGVLSSALSTLGDGRFTAFPALPAAEPGVTPPAG